MFYEMFNLIKGNQFLKWPTLISSSVNGSAKTAQFTVEAFRFGVCVSELSFQFGAIKYSTCVAKLTQRIFTLKHFT